MIISAFSLLTIYFLLPLVKYLYLNLFVSIDYVMQRNLGMVACAVKFGYNAHQLEGAYVVGKIKRTGYKPQNEVKVCKIKFIIKI